MAGNIPVRRWRSITGRGPQAAIFRCGRSVTRDFFYALIQLLAVEVLLKAVGLFPRLVARRPGLAETDPVLRGLFLRRIPLAQLARPVQVDDVAHGSLPLVLDPRRGAEGIAVTIDHLDRRFHLRG